MQQWLHDEPWAMAGQVTLLDAAYVALQHHLFAGAAQPAWSPLPAVWDGMSRGLALAVVKQPSTQQVAHRFSLPIPSPLQILGGSSADTAGVASGSNVNQMLGMMDQARSGISAFPTPR